MSSKNLVVNILKFQKIHFSPGSFKFNYVGRAINAMIVSSHHSLVDVGL